jgi:hypothetical protein
MLTESSAIDRIEVLAEARLIQIRRVNRVLRDGVEIAKTYHRHVLGPTDSLEGQDPQVVAVAQAFWQLSDSPEK